MAEVVTPGPAQGNVASGAADSGDPVKVGGVYNSSAPSLTSGQRGDVQLEATGELRVTAKNQGFSSPADGQAGGIGLVQNFGSTSSLIPCEAPYMWTGAAWVGARTPNVFKLVSAVTASGNTAVWTPASGKKFRLMGYQIFLSDQAKASAAADLVISFQDATTAIGAGMMAYVPTAITAGEVNPSSGPVDLGNGYLSTTANNVLNVNLSFALTGGSVAVAAWGTEE